MTTTTAPKQDLKKSSALDNVVLEAAMWGPTNAFVIDPEDFEFWHWIEILDELRTTHMEWGRGLKLLNDFGMIYFEQDSTGVVTLGMSDPWKAF